MAFVIMALALGVFVGGVLQVMMQVPALLRLHLLRLPRWNPASQSIWSK